MMSARSSTANGQVHSRDQDRRLLIFHRPSSQQDHMGTVPFLPNGSVQSRRWKSSRSFETLLDGNEIKMQKECYKNQNYGSVTAEVVEVG